MIYKVENLVSQVNKSFEQNFFLRKRFFQMIKPDGKIILTAGQYARSLTLN